MDHLTFDWPSPLELRAATVNGTPATTQHLESRQLQVRHPAGEPIESVHIHWLRRRSRELPAFGSRTQERPTPLEVRVGLSTVRIIAPNGQQLSVRDGLDPVDQLTHLLARLEKLVAAAAGQAEMGTVDATTWSAVLSLMDRADRYAAFADPDDERLEQLADLSAEVALLARLNDLASSVSESGAPGESFTSFTGDRQGLTAIVPATGQPLSYWLLDTAILRGGISTVLVVCCWWFANLLVRIQISERLHQYYPLSWAILGVAWWFWFQPSVLGLLLVGLAGWLFYRHRSSIHRSELHI